MLKAEKDARLVEQCLKDSWYPKTRGEGLGNTGRSHCALCQEYNSIRCPGCPIAIKTGAPYCKNTPYQKYCVVVHDHQLIGDRAEIAAWDEVTFLETLRAELWEEAAVEYAKS